MRNRTWPVFLIGLGTLLLLIFLPGIAALRQSAAMFDEIRSVQDTYERTQEGLFAIEQRTLQASILVRDFVLDTAPDTAPAYRDQFRQLRRTIDEQLARLTAEHASIDTLGFDELRGRVNAYCASVEPVFTWTAAERAARGTYFLREQQRPRRQSVIAIADQISRLLTANYRLRYQELESSQRTYRRQLGGAVALAFLVGVGVAFATSVRIALLERRAADHQQATERAEREMRSLSGRLMKAQEDERRAISRELHDEVGQTLTALRIELGAVERLRSPEAQDLAGHLDEAKSLAEQALHDVRDIAVGLRPSVLDLGLGPALQWQARQFTKRTGIDVAASMDNSVPALRDDYATCVYRIVQEALTNSMRHAGARRVEVEVSAANGELDATISDDGAGLRDGWDKGRGLGLVGMEERARELGGTVAIESTEGKGTTIRVRLPLIDGDGS